MTNHTPTESLIGFDGDGVHDLCAKPKRPHSWRTLHESLGSIHLMCDRCGTETNNAFLASLPRECPGEETTRIILPGPLAEPKASVLSRETAPHWCRTVNCGNTVEHCGDTCARCTSEIDTLKKQYDEMDRKANKVGLTTLWTIIPAVLFAIAALAGYWLRN